MHNVLHFPSLGFQIKYIMDLFATDDDELML